MIPPLLDVDHIYCGYQQKTILENITFQILHSELVSIIGPNGSGKTTLLKTISRLIKPHNGTIRLNGINIQKLPLNQLAQQMAVVSQIVEPIYISVESYVLMGRLPYFKKFQFFESKADIHIAENCMKRIGVWDIRHALMNELSDGQRQLAAIARAMAQEPILLLLDEPTAHLDIAHQIQILNLIKKMNRELDITVLMIIHDLNLACEYSDRLILLKNGEIKQMGEPEHVISYQTIEEVFDTLVIVNENPLSGKPCVFLVTDNHLKKINP